MKHFGSWNTEEHAVNKNTPDNITWIKLDGGNNQFSAKKTQNLLKRTTFRVLLSQLVLIILMSSVAVSLILMLVGIFSDQRTCLTVGCILGLAAFGAILHGCLSHRSLPDSTTPIVLSAACMYPVGNLALTTDHNATAAAMATATFIPKTFQHPSSMMTSSLEASVLSQLQKKQSFPFPPGPTIMARQNSFHTLSIPLPYRRNVSDPVAARRSHVLDRSSEDPPVDAKVVQYAKQHSCPVEQATLNEEHLYANDLVWTGCSTAEHSDLSLNCDQTVEGMMIPKRDGIKKQTEVQQISPEPPVKHLQQPSQFSAHDDPPSADCVARSLTYSGRMMAPSGLNEQPKVRLISPPILRPLIKTSSFARSPNSRDILRILSHCETGEYSYRLGRRYNRERDDIFGPRVWRGWRSWIDP